MSLYRWGMFGCGDVWVWGWGVWVNGWEWVVGGGISTRKSFEKYFFLKFTKEFPLNLSRTSSWKIYKRIPFNFDMGSFYKGFPWKKIFTRKSFVKNFRNFKLESDFFPHFLSKIRKLENSAHLFILDYNWANFQRNRGQKNSSLSLSLHFTHSLTITLIPKVYK